MLDNLSIYSNAAILKRKNKRLTILSQDDSIYLEFKKLNINGPKLPAAVYKNIDNKIDVNSLRVSFQTMEDIIEAYLVFKQENQIYTKDILKSQ
jgi:hypothetical protein